MLIEETAWKVCITAMVVVIFCLKRRIKRLEKFARIVDLERHVRDILS